MCVSPIQLIYLRCLRLEKDTPDTADGVGTKATYKQSVASLRSPRLHSRPTYVFGNNNSNEIHGVVGTYTKATYKQIVTSLRLSCLDNRPTYYYNYVVLFFFSGGGVNRSHDVMALIRRPPVNRAWCSYIRLTLVSFFYF